MKKLINTLGKIALPVIATGIMAGCGYGPREAIVTDNNTIHVKIPQGIIKGVDVMFYDNSTSNIAIYGEKYNIGDRVLAKANIFGKERILRKIGEKAQKKKFSDPLTGYFHRGKN